MGFACSCPLPPTGWHQGLVMMIMVQEILKSNSASSSSRSSTLLITDSLQNKQTITFTSTNTDETIKTVNNEPNINGTGP